MGSHGVPAESLEAFLHTERWRAREEEETSYHHQHDELEARHQTVAEVVTRIKRWMVTDQMDTDTSQMG
jgi:hypothetical protein